jgi:phage shock protein A
MSASPESRARDVERRQERLGKADAAFSAAHAELAAEVATWGLTHEQIWDAFRTACQDEAARRQRHRDVRTTLAQLPQLFIAV